MVNKNGKMIFMAVDWERDTDVEKFNRKPDILKKIEFMMKGILNY